MIYGVTVIRSTAGMTADTGTETVDMIVARGMTEVRDVTIIMTVTDDNFFLLKRKSCSKVVNQIQKGSSNLVNGRNNE